MTGETSKHWDNVYQNKAPDEVSWFQANPELSLKLIAALDLDKTTPIIDVGGGESRLAEHLLDKKYTNLTVLDISSIAIAQTKRRLADSAEAVSWLVSDITEFKPPIKFGLWHDRAVFHFMTSDAEQRSYLEALKRGLKPGGYVVIATFAIGGPQKCSGLPVVQYSVPTLQSKIGPAFELIHDQQERHTTPDGNEQLFHYFCFRFVVEGVN